MVCIQVQANSLAVTLGGSNGHFQVDPLFIPKLAQCLQTFDSQQYYPIDEATL